MARPGYQPETIRFGEFELDADNRELLRRGTRVKLQPQPFDVLLLLVESAGRVVTREEIRKRIWNADTFVDFERSINFAVNQIRSALRDDPERPRFIETVPKRGYRFIGKLDAHARAADPATKPISIDSFSATAPREAATVPTQALDAERHVAAPPELLPTSFPSPQAYSANRQLGRMLLWAFALLVATVGAVFWIRSRGIAPAELQEQQLTHASNDNPVRSAAVSPDGKYLAFSDDAGLHVRLLGTGEIRNFADPPPLRNVRVNWRVCWLPDSVRFLAVAFGLGQTPGTWQGSVLGETFRLVRDDAIAWSVSPDGSRVAFTANHDGALWSMGAGGEDPQRIATIAPPRWISHVQWSADASHLLYLNHNPTAARHQASIETRDVHTGQTATLLPDADLRELRVLRNRRILYVLAGNDGANSCRLWSAQLDSAASRLVEKPRLLPSAGPGCVASPSATADGRQLYLLKQVSEFTVYVADVAPDLSHIAPPKHLTLTDSREFPAAWTPDSREVIFVSDREGTWGFYRQPIDGDAAVPSLTRIATGGLGASIPRVSPDGAWLVYAPYPENYTPGDMVDLLRVSIRGGPPQRIMSVPLSDTPRCALAPSRLCAVATQRHDQLIFTAFDPSRGQGTEVGRIEVDPAQSYSWDLSPDAATIAVLKRGSSEIALLTLATHKQRTLHVRGWQGLASLDWDRNGSGLFTSSVEKGSTLLHVDLEGNAHVLWESRVPSMTWAIPSPDGLHIAMPGFALSSNVWLLEGF